VSKAKEQEKKLLFSGNGGSAAISSHKALDFINAGGIRAVEFTSPSMLTCYGNDYRYECVFQKSIEHYADSGDMLITISSSGKSRNILLAIEEARKKQCLVVTFSGFAPDNPLRTLGDVNFYIDSTNYTLVENAHEILLDAFLACWLHPRFKGEAASRHITFTPDEIST
jgi:D-sedoheptulose 7-phosphate isomerase